MGTTISLCSMNNFGGFDLSKIKDDEWFEKHNRLISYRWDLAEISFDHPQDTEYCRFVKFPLEDHLVLNYRSKSAHDSDIIVGVTFHVLNWQLKGYPFDVVDFINTKYTEFTGEGWPLMKIYRNMKFYIASVSMVEAH